MTGLILKLAPQERVLINGAVIENGNRRCRINIRSPGAHILRLRDAIHPSETDTPVKRLCYAVQLVLSGDADLARIADDLDAEIRSLADAMVDMQSRARLDSARAALRGNRPYQALRVLRDLIDTETRLLGRAS